MQRNCWIEVSKLANLQKFRLAKIRYSVSCVKSLGTLFQIYLLDNHARHFIYVDGNKATFTQEYDHNIAEQSGATSIVLRLVTGQQVHIAIYCTCASSGTVRKSTGTHFWSWFEVALLHLD